MWRVLLLALLTMPQGALAWTHGVGTFVGQIATRSIVPDNLDATKTQMMSRSGHFARTAVTSLQIAVANFASADSTFVENSPGNAASITASIEYPSGTCTQVKFSGSATGSVPNHNVLVSDATSVSIPNGAKFWVRLYQTSAGGVVYNNATNGTQNVSGNPMGDAVRLGTSAISDQTVSCDAITDNSGGDFHPPFAIIGATSTPALCLLGDSATVGAVAGPDSNGNSGAVQRSLGPSFSFIGLAIDGSTAAIFNTNANVIKTAFQWCSHYDVEWCNDIVNGASLGTFEASLTTLYSTITNYTKNPGSTTIFQTTNTPNTATTDSWATLANQSTRSFESVRTAFNDALRAGSFGPNGGYFDFAQPLEAPTLDGGKWNAGASYPACTSGTGTETDWTIDGVHAAGCGSNAVASSGVFATARIHYP